MELIVVIAIIVIIGVIVASIYNGLVCVATGSTRRSARSRSSSSAAMT